MRAAGAKLDMAQGDQRVSTKAADWSTKSKKAEAQPL